MSHSNIISVTEILATTKHADQRYGGVPYVKHLQDVVNVKKKYERLLPEDKRDIVEAACWGHDLIEDTRTSAKKIGNEIGNTEVADIIFACSNEIGKSRKESNFKTYHKIWENPLAKFVKLCDRIANMRNSWKSTHPIYQTYREEYPTFRYALYESGEYEEMWAELECLQISPTLKFKDDIRPHSACYDCSAPYHSWPDYTVNDDIWELINPTKHEGAGLLCPSCVSKRLSKTDYIGDVILTLHL